MKAFTIFDQLLNGDINPSLFTNITGRNILELD